MAKRKTQGLPAADPFATAYPNVARWLEDNWIELGRDERNMSFIRVLDCGGMPWEGEHTYSTTHEALLAANAFLAEWFEANG